jgi:hypothetical protein
VIFIAAPLYAMATAVLLALALALFGNGLNPNIARISLLSGVLVMAAALHAGRRTPCRWRSPGVVRLGELAFVCVLFIARLPLAHLP